MEAKRLIPYSVHLPEPLHKKLKEIAGNRKASGLVRDAITMIIEGDDAFNSGYNKAIRDVWHLLQEDYWCKALGIEGQSLSLYLAAQITPMIVPQNVKGKSRGNKAKT